MSKVLNNRVKVGPREAHLRHLSKITLNANQRAYLRRLGLSIGAVKLYDYMLQGKRLTAQDAAALTLNFPSAHYRLFYELENNKLVRRIRGRPLSFEALPLPLGLRSSFQNSLRELRQLSGISNANGKSSSGTHSEIIIGRQSLYDAYEKLAGEAKHEIYLFSIGIAYSTRLEKTQRFAVKRGVSIKHVVQRKKLSNQYVIAKWLRAGVKLRYLKLKQGFHFFVIDNTYVCISFSDPDDTENRLSILTNNETAIQLFTGQFRYLWQQAKAIEP